MPKTTALTALTTPDLADLLVTIDDPGGTPITKKITSDDFLNGLGVDYASIYRITANLSTRGGSIADYFDASSAFPTVLNGVYLLEWDLYFLKTTAGTVTFTLTNTQTYTNLVAGWRGNVITGIAATGAVSEAAIVTATSAASALPVTGSLSNGANHHYIVRALAECGTAGNIRLRVTCSAGTITPLRGSAFYGRRLASGNVGTFVA